MRKKLTLSIIFSMLCVLMFSNVFAQSMGESDIELEIPPLEALGEGVDPGIEAHGDLNGKDYTSLYSISFQYLDGWHGGSYGPARLWNYNMPTSMPQNPFPFDVKISSKPENAFIIALSSRAHTLSKNYAIAYTGGYCVGWGVPFGDYKDSDSIATSECREYDYHELRRTRNGDKLTDGGMKQVSYVLTYAYNYPMTDASTVHARLTSGMSTVLDGIHCYGADFIDQPASLATQYLCWLGSNQYILDDANRSKVEDYFFERSWSGNGKVVTDGVERCYITYRDKIMRAMRMPTYSYENDASAKEHSIKLEWNEANERFEATVNDGYNMHSAERVRISYNNLPESLHIEQKANGDILIYTEEVVGSREDPYVVPVEKNILDAKEAAIVSKSSDKLHQPIAVAVPGEIRETQYMSVYTEAIKIRVKKELNPINGKYGDAYVKDCVYGIYEDEACQTKVAEVRTKEDGYSEKTTYLPYKKYWAKEISNNESTYYNSKVYPIEPTSAVKDDNNDLVCTFTAKNDIVKTRLDIIKYLENPDSTEESPAKGAVLRLTLQNPDRNETYTATVNADGAAVFENIPWGTYTLEEDTTNSDYHLEIEDKTVVLHTPVQNKTYKMIIEDEKFMTFLKAVKIDKVTKREIVLPNAEFKIYDCQKNEFVTWFVTEERIETEILKTNEEGVLITPQELQGGKYVIYEVNAPEGYYLDPKYTEPEDKTKLGDVAYGGIEADLTKAIEVEEITVEGYKDKCFVHTKKIEEEPLKAKLQIYKEGEMLTGFSQSPKKTVANDETYNLTKPTYTNKGLANVEFIVKAKNDIMSPDGTQCYERAGTEHRIITGPNGYGTSEDLFLGTYEIIEVSVPLGYVKEKNIEDVVLENKNQTKRTELVTKKIKNSKQPTEVDVEKVLENPKYDVKEDHIGVVIGIYSNEDIFMTDGTKIISKDTLLDVVEGEINTADIKNGKNSITLKSNVNLPNNKSYYAKELYVDYPYEMETEKQVFEVKANNTDDETLKIYGITINNDVMDTAELAFVKISTSAIIDKALILYGGVLSDAEYDDIMDPIINWVKSNPASTVKAVFNGEQEPDNPDVAKCRLDPKYTLSGAVYSVYYDKDKKEPLTQNGVPVKITTDEKGFASLDKVPIREYYIFEEVAPVLIWKDKDGEHFVPYEKQEEPIKVSLSREDKDKSVARIFTDDINEDGNVKFTKEDIFTGELIPECTFEITNSDGEVIVNAVTDEEGKYQLDLDWFNPGEKYYYREISAPDVYDLNTEPHEFKIEFDENGEIIQTKIENRRKTRDLLIRKTDAETGESLQGCVFTIAMINEDGTQKVNAKTGEPIYLVENAVTDENGEYYIDDAPMGTYMFTEITPPEGYELDEDLTGYKFTLDENSPELTIFEVTNTGDIAVIAIACVGLVSILGIAFVVLKNKKQRA